MHNNERTLLIILGILLIAAIIGVVIWLAIDVSDDNNHGKCHNITNTYKGHKLDKIRIYLDGCRDLYLSPSALNCTKYCYLGDSSQPLNVVRGCEEPNPNWSFEDNGLLRYNDGEIFENKNNHGINGNYYLTYTKPKKNDEDNSYDAWYGIEDLEGKIYAASMTISKPSKSKGCYKPLCVSWEEENGRGYIVTSIKGKKYYLTANTENNFVFWYESNEDQRFKNKQIWSVKIDDYGYRTVHDCSSDSGSECGKKDYSCKDRVRRRKKHFHRGKDGKKHFHDNE